jgi:hypothetical protein
LSFSFPLPLGVALFAKNVFVVSIRFVFFLFHPPPPLCDDEKVDEEHRFEVDAFKEDLRLVLLEEAAKATKTSVVVVVVVLVTIISKLFFNLFFLFFFSRSFVSEGAAPTLEFIFCLFVCLFRRGRERRTKKPHKKRKIEKLLLRIHIDCINKHSSWFEVPRNT